MPTSGDEPCSAASPNSESCGTTRSHLTPAPTLTRLAPGSMETPRSSRTSTRSTSSSDPSASALWPVACGATRSPFAPAYSTAAITSLTSRGSATAAGLRSVARLKTRRVASQSGSEGVTTRPVNWQRCEAAFDLSSGRGDPSVSPGPEPVNPERQETRRSLPAWRTPSARDQRARTPLAADTLCRPLRAKEHGDARDDHQDADPALHGHLLVEERLPDQRDQHVAEAVERNDLRELLAAV
jgi:hypothetical protein